MTRQFDTKSVLSADGLCKGNVRVFWDDKLLWLVLTWMVINIGQIIIKHKRFFHIRLLSQELKY
jgi:hypothetical protein